MSTLVDALLSADAGKISNIATTTVEVPRLTKILGVPFMVKLQSVPIKRMNEIQETSIQMTNKGRYAGTDINQLQMLTLCASIADPDLGNKELQKKLHAATPKEVLEKLFLAGEIQMLYDKVQEVSGYTAESEQKKRDEVKN